MFREIVLIDEEKCDGCGLCVPACHEGAIRIEGGRARLVAENLCDGLGACLGHCPKGAIRIERREAADFDETAVESHLRSQDRPAASSCPSADAGKGLTPAASDARPLSQAAFSAPPGHGHAGGCPSQRFVRLGSVAVQPPVCPGGAGSRDTTAAPSDLMQWPVQLRLLPPRAPVFQGADLLLAADCVPFALSDFHHQLLRGHALAIACPKLDDTSTYVAKLTEIFAGNELRSIAIVHMEVPCCTGILAMALQARANAGLDLPIEDVVISVRGEVLRRRLIPVDAAAV